MWSDHASVECRLNLEDDKKPIKTWTFNKFLLQEQDLKEETAEKIQV